MMTTAFHSCSAVHHCHNGVQPGLSGHRKWTKHLVITVRFIAYRLSETIDGIYQSSPLPIH